MNSWVITPFNVVPDSVLKPVMTKTYRVLSSFRRTHSRYSAKTALRSRFALSTVVTSLIILVIAVLLAGVVANFAINVSSTRQQEESVALMKQHVWHDNRNQVSEAAVIVVNTGGRDIVICKLTVRGQSATWESVFYVQGYFSLPKDLEYIPSIAPGSLTTIDNGEGSFEAVAAATSELTLQSGESMVLYLKNPDSISASDVGLTVSISVYTSQAMYYKEVNVQGTAEASLPSSAPSSLPSAAPGGSFVFSNLHAWYDITGDSQAALLVQNSGSQEIAPYDVIIDGAPSYVGSWFVYVGTFTLVSDLLYITDVGDGSTVPGYGYVLTDIYAYPTACSLSPGESMIMYFRNPSAITVDDVGLTVSINVADEDEEIYALAATVQGVA